MPKSALVALLDLAKIPCIFPVIAYRPGEKSTPDCEHSQSFKRACMIWEEGAKSACSR